MPATTTNAGRQRLAGRHIVVTGAASGVGKAIAKLFCLQGAVHGLGCG